MSQSRARSAVESAVNVAIGYVIAVGAQYAIFPAFELHVGAGEHLAIAGIFTAISLVRSYALRRLFNAWR